MSQYQSEMGIFEDYDFCETGKRFPGAFDTREAAEEVAHVNREADGSWYYRVEKDLGYWYIEVYDEEKNHLGRLGEME